MLREIVEHLYSYKDYEYHSINSFLKENYNAVDITEIRKALIQLAQLNRIEVENRSHEKLNNMERILDIDKDINTLTDLDNWPIYARLTLPEREKLDKEKSDKEASRPNQTINMGNNYGSVAQFGSAESFDFNPIITPPGTPTKAEPKQGVIISIGKLIIKHIVAIIITVVGGVIVGFILWKLHWV